MIYSKTGKREASLQRELTASPTQLQSLHQKVMLTWKPTPNLNVCIIPWYHAVTIENSTQEVDRKEKPAWCFKKWETIFKDTVSWLLKDLSFKFLGGGKYGLFWAKELMEIWYLLINEKFLFWTIFGTGNTVLFEINSWWKDDTFRG